ncbi:MAG: hypothetical protein A3B68_05835 [Candidatus Melainabacteria bacterium RIFCSPHIGHO2_02_FULL_34_12]|nr:MAG: hypothetical protein A3B68_05835 [Candidatus Melainabacteria bacterium RIFCSPHIGHO2_02_FULL_34_12]
MLQLAILLIISFALFVSSNKTLAKDSVQPVMSTQAQKSPQEVSSPDNRSNEVDESFLSDDELSDENITTKIYKSTDPSLDLLELDTNLDPSLENDVLTKDELLRRNKKNLKSKIIDKNIEKYKALAINGNGKFFPWVMLVILIIAVWGLFKVILKRKI